MKKACFLAASMFTRLRKGPEVVGSEERSLGNLTETSHNVDESTKYYHISWPFTGCLTTVDRSSDRNYSTKQEAKTSNATYKYGRTEPNQALFRQSDGQLPFLIVALEQ